MDGWCFWGEEDAGFDVVKSAVVLRGGWLVFLGEEDAGFDVVKSAVVLRGGWLVFLGRRMQDLMLLRVQ